MKKLLLFLLLVALGRGQMAFDIQIPQVNSAGTSFVQRRISPAASSLLGFASDKELVNVTFDADDFDFSSNELSIDYANGQAASSTTKGFLTASDWATFNAKGSGTLTAISIAIANGFAGSSSGGATPELMISTTVTGMLKGDGEAIEAAEAGTDYVAPGPLSASGLTADSQDILFGNGNGIPDQIDEIAVGAGLTLFEKELYIDQSFSPEWTGQHKFASGTLGLRDTDESHVLQLNAGSDITANRALTFTTGDAARTITLSGNPTLGDWFDQSVKTGANVSFANINNTPIGTTTASSGSFTSLTASGDFTMSGSGKFILGDFSGTIANRPMIKTSTTNGNTFFGLKPDGTGTSSGLNLFGLSDVTTNSFRLGLTADSGNAGIINVLATGTATSRPLWIQVQSNTVAEFTSSGLSTSALTSTVGDSIFGFRAAGASGKVRIGGYSGGSSFIDAVNAAENATINLNIAASTISFTAGGNAVGLFTSTGLNGTTIGATTPSTGVFTGVTVTGVSGPVMSVTNTGTSGTVVLTNTSPSAGNTSSNIGLGNNDGASLASGDRMGALVFFGNNGGGPTSITNTALIGCYANQNWSNGTAYGSRLEFDVTENGNVSRLTAFTIAGGSSGIRFNQYGAGTLQTDSSGNITATSDERAKDNLLPFTKGLDVVRKAQPKSWTWKKETGLVTDDFNAGLTAQELIAAGAPEATYSTRTVPDEEEVTQDGNSVKRQKKNAKGEPVTKRVEAEYMTVSRDVEIAILWNAVKELADKNDALEKRVAELEQLSRKRE